MKKVILTSAIAISVGVLAGCASGPSFSDLDTQAKNEMAVAKKMKFLWRDTGKILATAEKTEDKAGAEKAIEQAKLAQAQAKEQANPAIWY
jgi:hypothetical protein